MKKFTVSTFVLAILFTALTGICVTAKAQDTKAHVFFFRLPNYVGSAEKMTLLANGQPLVRLRNAGYFVFEAEPGDYIFRSSASSSSQVSIKLEAGKDYYINCYLNMGFWTSIPILELVDPVSGRSTVSGNRLKQQFPEEISVRPRYGRIGLYMGGGMGFETVPWFEDENGRKVTLSTGGGFSGGLDFGYQVNRNFDISATLLYQISMLSETLNNADGSYERTAFLVTPSYVIPIRNGESLRLKIGAGAGIYSGGKMIIEGAKAGGYDFTLKYGTSVGFHGLFAVNTRMFERGSGEIGIKYVNVRYSYESNDKGYTVIDQKLLKPDGSGIEFYLGYYFQF